MEISDERIQEILELKEHITEKIESHEKEIEMLKRNMQILDSMIKKTSFTKASDLHSSAPPKLEGIPITRGSSGDTIANAYVAPEQISIIPNDDISLDPDTPPLRSFFIDRIIGEMKKKDATDVQSGKIQDPIDVIVNKNGQDIREIIIKNYRQKERADEIIKTASWTMTKMLEKTDG